MLNLIHRGVYVCSILFFMCVGWVVVLLGEVTYLEHTLTPETFAMLYTQADPNVSITTTAIGVCVGIISMLLGFGGGMIVRFSRKDIIPKNVNVMCEQNVSVFLVDGKVFKRTDAEAFNLQNLGRIRLTITRNLYYVKLEEYVSIAPEEEKDIETEILFKDSERENVEDRNDSYKL